MKKRVQPKTCYVLGIISAVFYLIYAVLILVGFGNANLLRTIAFVFTGAMLLFMSTSLSGKENQSSRMRLLFLFLIWFVSYFSLPPFSELCGALVLPIFSKIYGQRKHFALWLVLLFVELAHGTAQTLFVTKMLGVNGTLIYGISLVLLALARGTMLIVLLLAAKPSNEDAPDAIHRLR